MSSLPSNKAIVLLSGGLDSSTTLAIAKNSDYQELFALSFNYGQKNYLELQKAKKLAEVYRVAEHKIIELDLRQFAGSSLTSDLEVEKNRAFSEIGSNIPSTYVPARNTLFLSYALAWAEVLKVGHIFIGVNAVDHSGYPDCRPEYIAAFAKLAKLATVIGTADDIDIQIHTPLIELNKAQIIQKGLELDLDYSMTASCYDPLEDGLACGICDSCRLRQKAFKELGMKDPLPYKTVL